MKHEDIRERIVGAARLSRAAPYGGSWGRAAGRRLPSVLRRGSVSSHRIPGVQDAYRSAGIQSIAPRPGSYCGRPMADPDGRVMYGRRFAFKESHVSRGIPWSVASVPQA